MAHSRGYRDIRPPHVHILANMRRKGVRLTDLAGACQLSLATTSEFVTELQQLGYLERRRDPHDGRAKLIVWTDKGQRLFADAGHGLAEIEGRWSDLVGDRSFETACQVFQQLLDRLASSDTETASSTRTAS